MRFRPSRFILPCFLVLAFSVSLPAQNREPSPNVNLPAPVGRCMSSETLREMPLYPLPAPGNGTEDDSYKVTAMELEGLSVADTAELGKWTRLRRLKIKGEVDPKALPVIEKMWGLCMLEIENAGEMDLEEALQVIRVHSKVEYLSIYNSKQGNLPGSIGKLTRLRELKLQSNGFFELPPEMAALQNLRYLSLAGNQFSEIPSFLADLPALEYLDLHRNKLRTLPPGSLRFPTVEKIDIGGNPLKSIHFEANDLPKVEILKIGQAKLKEMPLEAANLPKLKMLDLFNNRIKKLPSNLNGFPKLVSLNLNGNKIKTLPQWAQDLGGKISLARNPISK